MLDLLKSFLLWTIHHNDEEFKLWIIGGILDLLKNSSKTKEASI